MNGGRDPAFEREFLRQAERLAGNTGTGWAQEVEDRLYRMEREKGPDSYLDLSLAHLLNEIDAEGLDIGGWSVLAVLASYAKIPAEDERGHELRMILQQLAAHGPLVHLLVARARDLLSA